MLMKPYLLPSDKNLCGGLWGWEGGEGREVEK